MNVLVTGASRGLGFSLVKRFLVGGATVFAGVRTLSTGSHLQKLREAHPNALDILELDVTKEAMVREARREVGARVNTVDVLINNAAVLLGRDDSIYNLDLNAVEETINVNLLGPIRVATQFSGLIRNSKCPRILNVSSEAASFGTSGRANYAYSVSKAALNMFTRILRNELDSTARVYAVHPGRMRTDMGMAEFPLHPDEVAESIYQLVVGDVEVTDGSWFIDQRGQPMPL